MWIFIDWQTTLECVLISLLFAAFMTVVCFKPLGILQAFGYKCGKFMGWAGRKNNLTQPRLSVLALASLLACAVISLCFGFAGRWSAVIGLTAYVVFFVLYTVSEARHSIRGGAALTPRLSRLLITLYLLFAILIYIVVTLLNFAEYVWGERLFACLKYCALAVFPFTALPIICLAEFVTLLWEAPINRSYVKRAKAKLAAAEVTVVGITGSFGKTGAKNVLKAMLEKKYRVVATPSSYNTPLGIARTVNGAELEKGSVFIAEMGARRQGDIAELCALCPPDYSLITGICPQHLESFKTLENIVSTKGEIIGATKQKTFIAADCYDRFSSAGEKAVCCDSVKDIRADCTGTEFTLCLGGAERRVKTVLLGEHSAANIGLCAQLAYAMGVSLDDIAQAIGELEFVEHRLQLIKTNGVNILDDGYNSNVVGAEAALKVLRSFDGKKIVVTPGLVELGVLEESENEALGRQLVGLDFVILVGETLVRALERGYMNGGGEGEKLAVVPSLEKAQELLKGVISQGDTVLFLNDLPEIY